MKDLPEEFIDWFLITEFHAIARQILIRRAAQRVVEHLMLEAWEFISERLMRDHNEC